jgi:predicted transposase/invertase (TIGR01784 family)
LLGSTENRNLLIHFLNALLGTDLIAPISDVELLNPYNEKETLDDKINIVDVKAKDSQGNGYQIEIQILNHRYLAERMVYTWADLYSQQLKQGQKYGLLRPTYSIWILASDLLKNDARYLHDYQWRDADGQRLIEHGGIWLIELNKFNAEIIDNEQHRWLSFLKTGEQLDDTQLPEWMTTLEMEQAMTTLKRFSEKERDYHAYQARQNYLRVQYEIDEERDELRQANIIARQEKLLAEQDKLLAEQGKVVAEQGKAVAEQGKAVAEQGKAVAEQGKAVAEQGKAVAEQDKLLAEQGKAVAEQDKLLAEQEKEAALQREQLALVEIERLKALLNP